MHKLISEQGQINETPLINMTLEFGLTPSLLSLSPLTKRGYYLVKGLIDNNQNKLDKSTCRLQIGDIG